MSKKKSAFTKVCEDCNIVFQIFSHLRKTYCPSCADDVRVYDYQAHRTLSDNTKPHYSDEEKALLEKVLKGHLRPYQAALMMGRSTNAVTKKISRMRKEIRRESS